MNHLGECKSRSGLSVGQCGWAMQMPSYLLCPPSPQLQIYFAPPSTQLHICLAPPDNAYRVCSSSIAWSLTGEVCALTWKRLPQAWQLVWSGGQADGVSSRNAGSGNRWWYERARWGAETRVSPQPRHSTGSSQYLALHFKLNVEVS